MTLKTMAGVILSAAVEPNLIVDEAAVEAAKEENERKWMKSSSAKTRRS